MLDVGNGPQAMTQEGNDWIYGFDGLESRFRALRPTGVLSIWSTDPDPAFTKRLLKIGFKIEEVKARARARGGKKDGDHYFCGSPPAVRSLPPASSRCRRSHRRSWRSG